MCMLDVTGIDVGRGDEVIVFKWQIKNRGIGNRIGTIPLEILTNIRNG